MYHGIFKSEKEIFGENREWVHVEKFEEQCKILHDRNYSTLSIDEYLDSDPGNNWNDKSVVLTFDDGPVCHLKHALPVLVKYNLKAIFYIPVSWLNRPNRLTDNNLNEISGAGMEIGSHSMTHPDFRYINFALLENELRDSKIYLEQLLSKKVIHFSYPKGRRSRPARRLLTKYGYRSAVTVDRGINRPQTDKYSLYRLGIYGYTNYKKFEKLLNQRIFIKYYFQRYSGNAIEILAGSERKKNLFHKLHRISESIRFEKS